MTGVLDTVLDALAAHAGLIGLLFFFGFFILMTVWVFRPGSKGYYIATARIPLNEDEHEHD